ncbi:MAG: hypothetical protein IH892_13870 [Planctomycetes bacterium]|nr:hypothetical protein [Planctomycetota bacterium]
MNGRESDLVVLVADKNMEASVRGLLSRREALGLRQIRYEIYVHVRRDPGCFLGGHDFLRPMAGRTAHALVLFDRIGSGREKNTRESLEDLVTGRLASSGWDDRAAAIVIDPELEVWVWSDSPHVGRVLGWREAYPDVQTWLRERGMWAEGERKPEDPKAAVERVLRHVRKPRSSAMYGKLADLVSFQRCTDPSFLRLRQILAGWFAEDTRL